MLLLSTQAFSANEWITGQVEFEILLTSDFAAAFEITSNGGTPQGAVSVESGDAHGEVIEIPLGTFQANCFYVICTVSVRFRQTSEASRSNA